jgi:hypothetical protein
VGTFLLLQREYYAGFEVPAMLMLRILLGPTNL